MVNVSPEQNLPILNFVYHLLKPWSDRFAHVNGKQPQLQTSDKPRVMAQGANKELRKKMLHCHLETESL